MLERRAVVEVERTESKRTSAPARYAAKPGDELVGVEGVGLCAPGAMSARSRVPRARVARIPCLLGARRPLGGRASRSCSASKSNSWARTAAVDVHSSPTPQPGTA